MGPERQEGPEVLSARVGGPVAGVGLRRAGGGGRGQAACGAFTRRIQHPGGVVEQAVRYLGLKF